MKPYLIKRKCPAIKEMCKAIEACPQGAVFYVEDKTERLGGRIEFDYDKCDGCTLCVTACCGAAVEMH
jgi:Pyruvate/2-oxoacid:ferredoxin oxidoreductase delta subunit